MQGLFSQFVCFLQSYFLVLSEYQLHNKVFCSVLSWDFLVLSQQMETQEECKTCQIFSKSKVKSPD